MMIGFLVDHADEMMDEGVMDDRGQIQYKEGVL